MVWSWLPCCICSLAVVTYMAVVTYLAKVWSAYLVNCGLYYYA